jgi:predicted ester cyclase
VLALIKTAYGYLKCFATGDLFCVNILTHWRLLMSLEVNKEAFRRLMEEGFGKGNLAAVDELLDPNFREHQNGVEPTTREGVKALIRELRSIMPDLKLIIEDMTADGDKVWGRMKAQGTHRGTFMGKPPTGRAVTLDVIDICRFENGKIVEHWGVPDRLGMMEQLGLIPQG